MHACCSLTTPLNHRTEKRNKKKKPNSPKAEDKNKSKRRKTILTSRVQRININTQINRPFRPHPLSYLLHNPLHTHLIYLPRLHNLKPAVTVIVVIAQPAERRPYPGVDIAVVGQQPFLVRVVEVRPVVDGRLFGRGAAEDFGLPRVEVRVEVNDADRAVRGFDTTQQRQGDGMIPAQRDETRQGPPLLRGPRLVGVCSRLAQKQLLVPVLDLLQRIRIVIRRHGYVAAVEHRGPGVERVRVEGHVVTATETDFA